MLLKSLQTKHQDSWIRGSIPHLYCSYSYTCGAWKGSSFLLLASWSVKPRIYGKMRENQRGQRNIFRKKELSLLLKWHMKWRPFLVMAAADHISCHKLGLIKTVISALCYTFNKTFWLTSSCRVAEWHTYYFSGIFICIYWYTYWETLYIDSGYDNRMLTVDIYLVNYLNVNWCNWMVRHNWPHLWLKGNDYY